MNSKITVVRKYKFESAHHLTCVPEGHPCRRLHGHSYKMWVHVTGPVENYMVMEYGDIDAIVDPIVEKYLDHHDLNLYIDEPTVEMIIQWVWDKLEPDLPGLCKIRIQETERAWVEIER